MVLGELEIKQNTLTVTELHWKLPRFSSLLTDNNMYEDNDIVSSVFKFYDHDMRLYILTGDPFEDDNYVKLGLEADDYIGRSYEVMCTFGIVTKDGSVSKIKTFFGTLRPGLYESIDFDFISRDVLSQCDNGLVPSGSLTLMCYIKLLCDPMELKELNTLSHNIQGLFTNQELCDVTIHVKDKKFKAHKAIIAARSPVFAAMFKHDTLEKQTDKITVPDSDPDSFKVFLQYLYSGKLGNNSFRCVVHLFKIAHKYEVSELTWFCVDCIKQGINVENFFDVIDLAEEYDNDRLHDGVQDFFNSNIRDIFKTVEWRNLLENNFSLANKLLIEMSSNVEVVKKRPRLDI